MPKLEQSVAVITGAATGIGRALAARLADEGASLCLADINKEALDVVADDLRAKGCDVSAHSVDVADRQQVDTLCGRRESASEYPQITQIKKTRRQGQ